MASQFDRQTVIKAMSSKSVSSVVLYQNINTLAGQTNVFEIYAPNNIISKVLSSYMSVSSPTGASTGYHELIISTVTNPMSIIQARWGFNSNLAFAYSKFLNSPTLANPTEEKSVIEVLNNIYFDDAQPLQITYSNKTDVDNNNNMHFRFALLQEVVS